MLQRITLNSVDATYVDSIYNTTSVFYKKDADVYVGSYYYHYESTVPDYPSSTHRHDYKSYYFFEVPNELRNKAIVGIETNINITRNLDISFNDPVDAYIINCDQNYASVLTGRNVDQYLQFNNNVSADKFKRSQYTVSYSGNVNLFNRDTVINNNYICMRLSQPYEEFDRYVILKNNIELTILYDDPYSYAEIDAPVDIVVSNKQNITFSWRANSAGYQTASGRISLYITGGEHTVYNFTGNINEYTIPANTLTGGKASYSLMLTSTAGFSYTTRMIQFEIVGNTQAPTIIDVTHNAKPMINWQVEEQDAYEVRISADGQYVYHSPLLLGTDVRSFKIPTYLNNGTYTIEMRALNSYGYYTEWLGYTFNLNAPDADAPTDITASVNNKYGVEVSAKEPLVSDAMYVIRREIGGTPEVIGLYYDGYVDYSAKGNKVYEYTVSNYYVGRADGQYVQVNVPVDGAVIYDMDDPTKAIALNIMDNPLMRIKKGEKASKTLVQCLGRKYPIRELTEWVNTTRYARAYVAESDLNALYDLVLNSKNIYYKASNECFACDVEIDDDSDYVTGGKMIDFEITRISTDEVNIL